MNDSAKMCGAQIGQAVGFLLGGLTLVLFYPSTTDPLLICGLICIPQFVGVALGGWWALTGWGD